MFKVLRSKALSPILIHLYAESSVAKETNSLPRISFSTSPPTNSEPWLIKPGSMYDGDSLRLVRGNEELRIRLCGIDAPEKEMPLGIESRDYLRSLIARGDGRVHLVRVEEDRYGRTVAELFLPIRPDFQQELHLNTEMVSAGMAWHYQQYSGKCPSKEESGWAENIAREDKVGVWGEGKHQEPWVWRKNHK